MICYLHLLILPDARLFEKLIRRTQTESKKIAHEIRDAKKTTVI